MNISNVCDRANVTSEGRATTQCCALNRSQVTEYFTAASNQPFDGVTGRNNNHVIVLRGNDRSRSMF